MRRATVLVMVLGLIAVFSLGFLYVGSTHRDRCIQAQRDGCSLLPWSGGPKPSGYLINNGGWGIAGQP